MAKTKEGTSKKKQNKQKKDDEDEPAEHEPDNLLEGYVIVDLQMLKFQLSVKSKLQSLNDYVGLYDKIKHENESLKNELKKRDVDHVCIFSAFFNSL
jgi:hypothetical protein